ncbi:mucin-4-like isoform X4 [Aquila chrysaetos chrysaetos]|uniref:mucin-4-like isoform X4 n=1 Tax=Aquila chrysaetos chrysaetos TaxID=223781 RepID=UPI001B7D3007|nr:mucin-4-like isoform X4 [Aquila chrysaetos chrysaetos]
MGTREWTLSTFMGCCIWILHGLGAAAATIPVTTEGLFAVGTASPTTLESERPRALVMGTAETNTVAANAEVADSTLVENLSSPSSPPGPEPDALVTAASDYGSTVPALTNVTKPLNTSQDIERGSAAPTAATTTAAISAQHPAVTPEAELDVTGAAPDAPLGTTPLFADVKEDILAALTREGADLDPTASAVSLPTTPPLAAAWGAQPTAGSPVGAGVTVLPSQGLTTATGAVEEGITLPVDTQSEAGANSSSPSPGTGGLLTTQQDGAVSRAVGITPEPVGEKAPAGEESPSALVHGDTGDAVNGEFSTVGSSSLPLESPTVSGTVGNPGEPSLLHGQAVLSPATLLLPAGGGDGDGQRAPGVLSEGPGSALSPAASEAPMAPKVAGDTATTPLVPTDTQSDTNPALPATALPTGDVGAVGLARPSLQPAPWQTAIGEQPPLLAAALPSPTDTPSAPGAAYPPPGTGASTLPAPDGGAEIPASPNLAAAPGAPVSPSLGESQPWGMAAGAPQGADGPGAGLSSASDAPIPASFVPDGLAWPTAGVQGQGAEGAGGTAQAGAPGDGNPSADTQSDMSPSDFSTQQDPANAGLLPAGATGALSNAELSPPSALGDGAGTGAVPALGQVSPPGPAPPSGAGLEPGLSGAQGPGDLPGESTSTPGAVAGPMSGAETAASLNPGAAEEAPMSPSFGGSQPWGTAAGGPQGAGLPGANEPGTGLTSAWDVSSSATYGPAEPPSPALGVQLGTNLGLPAAEGHGAGTAEPVLGGAGSGTSFEPSLSSTAGSVMASGMDQLPGAGSLSGPASPSDVVAASSISDPASPSALGGAGGAPGALQPSLGAGPGVPPAAGEGAGEAAGDGGSPEQSQATAREEPVGSGAHAGQMGAVLQTASASPSTEGSSSPGTAGKTANGASLQGAGAAGSGLSTGLEPAGPKEPAVSAPSIQSGANLGLSDAKLSQVNVVELPGGALVNRGASLGASLGEGTGAIIQIASGALAPSALTSLRERQPLDPVAPDSSGISDSMAASLAASLLLPGHGLSSGLAPSGDPRSAPGIQSGSRALVPGAQGGLAGDAGGAQMWSLEDEVASGMPAPLGEASPRALASPNTAPALPSAPQRQNVAAGVSASPGLSTPLSALAAVPLYGYGARENDRQYVERRVDFNSPLFKPETGFPFGKTLRNSLYFTDNGQIIFPASDNSIFTSPNPPPSGFNGHEEVPMIAVFWDNADFSRGVGTTFYQEFLTLNTAKPPFVRDVEAKVRRYLRSSYSAAWTLKITWEKAPAYAARTDTRRTITYQAVLTTDGFRSYVLMLYQEGGMQWDYTRLTATNVLIGYTSGDGFYRNDDLTQRPPAAKYRPDQFRGYNTDLHGLWIYKLESRVRVNYRLKCLAWTGQQQEPRVWSQGLPACPCSLQQGQQDPRFKSSRGGWWAARVSMLHSASPNQHGAGVRCLYDSQSQLIEGRQERYWRSSRQASPYRDQELKLYDWCCNQAGSARLCARYSEKRPKIGCDGYQPPSMGGFAACSSEEQESDSEEQRDGEDK